MIVEGWMQTAAINASEFDYLGRCAERFEGSGL